MQSKPTYLLKPGQWAPLRDLSRTAAEQGAVLVKNEHHTLPLKADRPVALFGRMQFDYIKSGTGSGGLVNVKDVPCLTDAMTEAGLRLDQPLLHTYRAWVEEHPFDDGKGAWAAEPWSQTEMEVSQALAEDAASRCDTAVLVIGRQAGEDHDNSETEGSYLLTQTEQDVLTTLRHSFRRVAVLLNVGNIIDMSWQTEADAILYLWQGGMDGAAAAASLLIGAAAPCGKLTDTIAHHLADYPAADSFGSDSENVYAEDVYVGYRYFETFCPEKVLYPFGFGLSYTTFRQQITAEQQGDVITLRACVTNTGDAAGREVVQAYISAPQGRLGRPARELCAFGKTGLLHPGEAETLTLTFALSDAAAFDDLGVTGNRFCDVLEAGEYRIYVGADVRSAALCLSVTLPALQVTARHEHRLGPNRAFRRIHPQQTANGLMIGWEDVPAEELAPLMTPPAAIPVTGDLGWKLVDVRDGKCTMEAFIGQMNGEELLPLCFGEGMNSPKVTPGTGGAFGGLSDGLRHYGIPAGCCTDGPSGLRLDDGQWATAMPGGTLLACTWDAPLQESLFEQEGIEMLGNGIDALLGTGMNIHRHPLCGRNFEYFSEDPLLTGRIAAAQHRGLGRVGETGTLKHFAGNDQEHRRFYVNACVSERALREIYLKGFGIAVREGGAKCVMTSYNPLNGVWTAANQALVAGILREEWGFDGIVMTDWWALLSDGRGEPDRALTHAMIRATNDLYMVTTDACEAARETNACAALADGRLTLGEVQRCAMNLCRFLSASPALARQLGEPYEAPCLTARWDPNAPDAHITDPAMLSPDAEVLALGDTLRFRPAQVRPACSYGRLPADRDSGALCVNSRNSFLIFHLTAEDSSTWSLMMDYRCPQEEQAQASLEVFVNDVSQGMLSLNGTDNRWIQVGEDITVSIGDVWLKLRFPRSGYEVDHITLTKKS